MRYGLIDRGSRVICASGVHPAQEHQLVKQPAIPKAPLCPLPLIEVLFERIGMDFIRPFNQMAQGYLFAFILVDSAIRYPDAVPLCSICTNRRCFVLPPSRCPERDTDWLEHIVHVFHNKMTVLMRIKSVWTSVYHPQTDGLVELLNKTQWFVSSLTRINTNGISG